jgi:hypothetical protein
MRNSVAHLNNKATAKEHAKALGYVSLAIGLTELALGDQLDKFLGTGDGENAGVYHALGVREICHGVDLLSHDDPTIGVWSRVAGDALDGMLLGMAAMRSNKPVAVAAAAAMVMPVVIADVMCATRLS